MLQVFPFLVWLATALSAVLLVALWKLGDLRPWAVVALLGWFLVAVYFQFLAASAVLGGLGLGLQTLLAISLLLRWRWIS